MQALLLMVVFRFYTLISTIYDSKEIVQFKYQSQSRNLTFQKNFAKLQFSPVLFEKILSFVYLVFKNKNKWILK